MPTLQIDRSRRSPPGCRPLLAACLLAPALAGCVDLLGDYKPSGCERADCAGTWARRFGDPDDQHASGVAVTAEGEIVVVGDVFGAIDFGGGARKSAGDADVFVAKLGPTGEHLWSARFGGPGPDYGNAVALDGSGDILVAGTFTGTAVFGESTLTSLGDTDVFVAKLSPGGDVQWVKRFGDSAGQKAIRVAADSAGNVVVTGCMAGSLDFGKGTLQSVGSDDAFVLKLDPAGNALWGTATGGIGSECGFRIAVDRDDNLLVAGIFDSVVTFEQPLATAGATDIYLVKLAPGGEALWSRSYGGLTTEIPGGLAAGEDGRVILTGAFSGTVDFHGKQPLTAKAWLDPFVLTTDAGGETLWSRGLGGAETEILVSAALDRRGDILVAGYSGPDAVNVDALLAKIGGAGDLQWSSQWEASGFQEATGVAVDPADDIVLVGQFEGALDIGGITLESAGAQDVFIAKLGKDATPPE